MVRDGKWSGQHCYENLPPREILHLHKLAYCLSIPNLDGVPTCVEERIRRHVMNQEME